MSQGARDSVMIAFRAERVRLLVATDVASRGLDVSQVSHVINYDLPDEPEVYIHRIGRTGRVGRDGNAISLVDAAGSRRKLDAIQRLTGSQIPAWTAPGDERRGRGAAGRRRAGGRGAGRSRPPSRDGADGDGTDRAAAAGAAAVGAGAGRAGRQRPPPTTRRT